MNNVDKLFRSKLENDQVTPRPIAWERIEDRLSKKNKTIIWMRWAAAIALASLVGSYWILNRGDEQAKTLAVGEKTPPVQKVQPKASSPVKESAVSASQSKASKKTRKVFKPVPAAPLETPVTQSAAIATTQPVVITTEPILVADNQVTSKPATKGVVLVYTLPSLAAPAVEPALALAANTVTEKQSGFQKLLEAAKDMKNSDNAWGDLREAKNDLLTFDFKKDKNRNQN